MQPPFTTRRNFFRHTAALTATARAALAQTHSVPVNDSDPVILQRRKQYLEDLQRILPRSTTRELTGRMNAGDRDWEAWLHRTGELPPDFHRMPSCASLPDPLLPSDESGTHSIKSAAHWDQQRAPLRAAFEQWIYGHMPPPPGNLRAVVTDTRREGSIEVRDVRLEFGPEHRGILHLQLFVPPGKGPLPVFLTNQPRNSAWIYPAIRRGYIACVYNATDPNYGVPDDSDQFIDVYPQYDFACIARWAWAGMRAVDYLHTLTEVDPHRIGITGHSRNSKQALLAAAFDPRIGAVVASSGTTGECLPWRYTTDIFWGTGSIQSITGGPHNTHWFHPRLRFFAGREHKVPVDQNVLMALVAPRGLAIYAAYSEHEGNHVGYEQAYRSALSVYRLLGHPDKIWLRLRDGEHDFAPSGIEYSINALDAFFGLRPFPKQETWISGYTFERWQHLSGERIDPLQYPETPRSQPAPVDSINWALGQEPPGLPFAPVTKLPAPPQIHWVHPPSDNPLAMLFGRPLKSPKWTSTVLPFGDGLRGDLYLPASLRAKMPVVVWLHPFAYATGYSRWVVPVFESLIDQGFAIFAFDQIGCGTRVLDARDFYSQYPHWSLMGKMVSDTRAAIHALSALDILDSSRVVLTGYALGGKVGLITAALDSRVKALAAVCACHPLRASDRNGTEGLRHYSHLHGLMPRLGFFIGHESRLPFDYDQVLAAIAPRPVLLIAPQLDRYAPVQEVRQVVERARALRPSPALTLETPLDFNRFPRERQEQVVQWLTHIA